MKRPRDRCAFKGFGYNGKPCEAHPKPGSLMCEEHSEMFAEWRDEAEKDPRLLYHQRSDNPNRQFTDTKAKKKRQPRLPTCCRPGCFEIRTPPDPFCSPACEAASGGNE